MISILTDCGKVRLKKVEDKMDGGHYHAFVESLDKHMAERKRIYTPRSEAELREVPEGKLVKIFTRGKKGIVVSSVVRYGGLNQEGEDVFTNQYLREGTPSILITERSSTRGTHGYDEDGGVVLSPLHTMIDQISPKNPRYKTMVRELKSAGIWEEI